MSETAEKLRIDKWLWQARFFKTRTLAAKQVTGGHVRVNGAKTTKASHAVLIGDVLTFAQAKRIRVVRVQAIGTRRGPAPEAQTLYEDMTEPEETRPASPIPDREPESRPPRRDFSLDNLDLLD